MNEEGRAMKHKRFSDEKIIGVLKEHEAGAKVDGKRPASLLCFA
jgi:hypothetical protein